YRAGLKQVLVYDIKAAQNDLQRLQQSTHCNKTRCSGRICSMAENKQRNMIISGITNRSLHCAGKIFLKVRYHKPPAPEKIGFSHQKSEANDFQDGVNSDHNHCRGKCNALPGNNKKESRIQNKKCSRGKKRIDNFVVLD